MKVETIQLILCVLRAAVILEGVIEIKGALRRVALEHDRVPIFSSVSHREIA